jgi:hypothetical protein
MKKKRLKLNAERTIKQNKAAENGKNIAYNFISVRVLYCHLHSDFSASAV